MILPPNHQVIMKLSTSYLLPIVPQTLGLEWGSGGKKKEKIKPDPISPF